MEIEFGELREGVNVAAGTCGVLVLTVKSGRCTAELLGNEKQVQAFMARHGGFTAISRRVLDAALRSRQLQADARSKSRADARAAKSSHTEPTPAGSHPRPVTS